MAGEYLNKALENFEGQLPEDHPYILTAKGLIQFVAPYDANSTVCKSNGRICKKFARSDDDYYPLAKVSPAYPNTAQEKGLEGWVMLEFTVDSKGRVIDPHVIASDGSGIFDATSIRATKKFRYKPKLVDGVPVDSPGVTSIITFHMEH